MKRIKTSGKAATLFNQMGYFSNEANMHKSVLIFISLCVLIIFFSGCSKKQNDEPAKNAGQDEPTKYAD